MVLPSQSARPKSRASHMYRGRRRRSKPMLLILLALLLVSFGVWRFMGPGRARSMAANLGEGTTIESIEREPELPRLPNPEPTREEQPPPRQAQAQPEQRTVRMGQNASPPPPSPANPGPARQEEPAAREEVPGSNLASPGLERPSPASRETERPTPTSPARERTLERMRAGMDLLATNRPVEARLMLTQALEADGMDAANAKRIRETLTQLNERLVFSPEVAAGDPHAFSYTVKSGDALSRIASGQNTNVDWRFIQRINRILRPESIRTGQSLKLVRGPFHGIVHKREFRMDLFLGEPGSADRVYVRSFAVGLGEFDSTPVGLFRVRQNSKLINPAWTNPRTGQHFHADDPKNPIGERWIGLEGVSESVRDLGGYGIHGTIEPRTIGTQASMGCVRMLAEDVELVYEMLVEEKSTVRIADGG